jgi:stress-induced morphogen
MIMVGIDNANIERTNITGKKVVKRCLMELSVSVLPLSMNGFSSCFILELVSKKFELVPSLIRLSMVYSLLKLLLVTLDLHADCCQELSREYKGPPDTGPFVLPILVPKIGSFRSATRWPPRLPIVGKKEVEL